jgi:TRAP-type C4-dicarboxylate transport system permease large subunit
MISSGILILFVCFFILVFIGVPIAYSLGIAGIATMLYSIGFVPATTTYALRMASGLDSFSLLAIPFFVLAGNIMNKGGIAGRLIDLARVLLGPITGRLALVNVISNMLFGAISGSAVASSSAIGTLLTPEMRKEGYEDNYMAAVNVTSATTGLSIPPSNVLIVYALASGGASIAALFIAGYVPGILTGMLIMIMAVGILKYNKQGLNATVIFALKVATTLVVLFGANFAFLQFYSGKNLLIVYAILSVIFIVYKHVKNSQKMMQAWKVVLNAIPGLLMLVLIIGGIIVGIFTATEASAVSVLYAVVLSYFYKELKISDLGPIILDSVRTTSIVLFLVSASMGLSWIIAYENIPQMLSDTLLSVSSNPFVILMLINFMLLAVGIFLDITPAILIFTPILLPVVQAKLGMDPVHFGIMLIMNLSIGLCTPPVGSVLFVGCKVANVKIESVIRPLIPIYIVMILALLAVSYFPELSLWLPRYLDLL